MSHLHIPELEKLPTQISPCPIVEAILEVRFVSAHSWGVLPGLLYAQIQERYSQPTALPLSQIPDEVRAKDPELAQKPLSQFASDRFLIQLGPQVVSLISNQNYPGWTTVFDELKWLLRGVQKAGFIKEGARLGLRYVDFFKGDLFPKLAIEFRSNGEIITGSEIGFTTVFERGRFKARLRINNSAFLRSGNNAQVGSIFDLDLWLPPSEFDVFENSLACYQEAHQLNKEVFFGLLKPEFLATLSPRHV